MQEVKTTVWMKLLCLLHSYKSVRALAGLHDNVYCATENPLVCFLWSGSCYRTTDPEHETQPWRLISHISCFSFQKKKGTTYPAEN